MTVTTDIFTLGGQDYLVTVDCHSSFIEVDYLKIATTDNVTSKLKSNLAWHSSPEIPISDNGPQFSFQSSVTLRTNGNLFIKLLVQGTASPIGQLKLQ